VARATRLSSTRAAQLRTCLDKLDPVSDVSDDPIQFVHRYENRGDREVAALFASALAFGRVGSFLPVLQVILEHADNRGGPATWVDNFNDDDADRIEPIFYRWIRGPDLARFARTIGRVRSKYGSIGAVFEEGITPKQTDIRPMLEHGVSIFQTLSTESPSEQFSELSRGYRFLLTHPASGSGCKRWCMLFRWMARTEFPDVGMWSIPTSALIIPLDTHIHQVADFIGLTRRKDGSWKTAKEITQNLARMDPEDPTRFDFALAHLGISGKCNKKRVAEICDECALVEVCRIGRPRNQALTG
jgi:uncharacterized protein (TIGR02757 family)